jgi:hypothetical protein
MENNKTHWRVLALIAFVALLVALLLLPPLPEAKRRASRIHQAVNTIASPFISMPSTNALPAANDRLAGSLPPRYLGAYESASSRRHLPG